MPPQDSRTLAETANISSDRIAPFASDDDHIQEDDGQHEQSEHTDFPPESFWLSKDAELDWFDRNAFVDRKDSTKANPNHNTNSNSVSNSNPSSQRFSVVTKKSKTSMIGLPKPQQKPYFVDARHRRNQTNNHLFPKRGVEANSGKHDAPMAEPSSPKVSCMGRVRSRRDRSRRLKNRQRSLKSSSASEKPMPPTTTIEQRRKKKCLWKNLRSIFFSGSGHKSVPVPDSQKAQANTKRTTSRSHVLSRERSAAVNAMSPPGLGGVARFSSGRRSDAWVGDVAEIRSGPLDGRPSLQTRREAGPLKEVNTNCGRDWGSVGPASV